MGPLPASCMCQRFHTNLIRKLPEAGFATAAAAAYPPARDQWMAQTIFTSLVKMGREAGSKSKSKPQEGPPSSSSKSKPQECSSSLPGPKSKPQEGSPELGLLPDPPAGDPQFAPNCQGAYATRTAPGPVQGEGTAAGRWPGE